MNTLLLDRPRPDTDLGVLADHHRGPGIAGALLDEVPRNVIFGVLPADVPPEVVIRALDTVGVPRHHVRFVRRAGTALRGTAHAEELTAGEALEMGHVLFSVRGVPPAAALRVTDRLFGSGVSSVRFFGPTGGSRLNRPGVS